MAKLANTKQNRQSNVLPLTTRFQSKLCILLACPRCPVEWLLNQILSQFHVRISTGDWKEKLTQERESTTGKNFELSVFLFCPQNACFTIQKLVLLFLVVNITGKVSFRIVPLHSPSLLRDSIVFTFRKTCCFLNERKICSGSDTLRDLLYFLVNKYL